MFVIYFGKGASLLRKWLPHDLWIVIMGMVLLYTGLSFIWPFNMVYMTTELGMSNTDASLVLLVNSFISMVASVIGGLIFDRLSGYVSLMIGTVILVIGTFLLMTFHSYPYFIWNLWIVAVAMGMVFAGLYAAAGLTHPSGGRTGFNAIYVAQNVGVAIGPFLAGFLAEKGMGNVYLGAFIFALMYAAFFFIFFRKIDWRSENLSAETKHHKPGLKREKATWYGLISFSLLLLTYLFCQLPHVQWQSNLSTYMTSDMGVTAAEYGKLWSINGLLIVLGQFILIPLIHRFKQHLLLQIYIGIVLFILSFVFAMQATVYSGFVLGMIFLTLGEMFAWPAIPTIAYRLAPNGYAGLYQGLVNGTATAARMLAPFLGALVVTQFGGITALFVGIFTLLLLAILTITLQKVTETKIKNKVREENYHEIA
ncbi:transporter [Listeria fleischmannii subsp. coloradonensis]|uniref:MFS transporter n=1 Tax=Listeria fleischmannii TaxID=1069827 RepID=A0A841YBN8_9LIST|nr:transporter [Listeria fleischmannii subsp. coloradonensis]MBC1397597.1 MFS transporter [Listeria fleischmannii]MBC1426862.1 MFS transporter [Listeria fleischmannii]